MKFGRARSFRPRPDVEKRLEDAELLELNVSHLINEVLGDHLTDYLQKHVNRERERLAARQKKLRELLAA
jgi:hypothetical protein